MDRKSYWNDKYVEYWRSRVAESTAVAQSSQIIAGDAKTEDDSVYEKVFQAYPFVEGSILDVGCAWGRMFPMFRSRNLTVSGVDISDAMINQCRDVWMAETGIITIETAEAEALPFPDHTFDNLACLAVFDATYQERALEEFFRVLKPGGHLYLTGKNTRYHKDDQRAYNAEVGARRKGHPNYFTDVPELLRQMSIAGHELLGGYYFENRGDFAAFRYHNTLPEVFYEFFVIFRRGTQTSSFTSMSNQYSETFRTGNNSN
jgi:SAM-dependent methyltransferase